MNKDIGALIFTIACLVGFFIIILTRNACNYSGLMFGLGMFAGVGMGRLSYKYFGK